MNGNNENDDIEWDPAAEADEIVNNVSPSYGSFGSLGKFRQVSEIPPGFRSFASFGILYQCRN
ncbi:hypothetical protein C1646_685437 [Rhizophagus diaphanus]|nr:hypothetical protein C1646_685437 [Rhizophagus diaphanus] [Rhizophagus sp. MUCL 43196]